MVESAVLSRKLRWLDFYDLTSPRRVTYLIRYAPDLPPRPLPTPERIPERIDWIWQNYEYHMRRMDWLQDDTLPCIDMLTGTEIFAEAFGCRILYPIDNNPAPFPLIHNTAEAETLQIPSLDAPPLRRVFEMADQLARRAGPGALFRLVDMQCPLDVAAMMWDKLDFYPALVKYPEVVNDLVEKITSLQFAFLDEWFLRYGKEFVAHYPDYYMPQGITLSVDEIGAVSGKMFLQYFLPYLNRFSEHFGGLGIHCCAHARHQWENLKKIKGLRLLNINNQGGMVREAYSFFADFVSQWHYDQSPVPLSPLEWLEEIPANAHVALDLSAGSRKQAQLLSEQFSRWNEKRSHG
jgi:hypothetical protein